MYKYFKNVNGEDITGLMNLFYNDEKELEGIEYTDGTMEITKEEYNELKNNGDFIVWDCLA